VMLEDAAMIQAADARYLNKRDAGEGRAPIVPLYGVEDVHRALSQCLSVPYHRPQAVAPGVSVTFLDAGHVLGSAVVVLDVDDEGVRRRIVFSGDLGRHHLPILRDPEVPSGAQALLLESTYGDRLHPKVEQMDEELAQVVTRTVARGGKVIIPSFALERAQELLFSIQKLRAQGRMPKVPVYVDSPLTVSITDVFRLHSDCFDEDARRTLASGQSPFEFDGLKFVSSREDSLAISSSKSPSIVIAASGMCEAGRVLHHLQAGIENPDNSVVIVGFQAQHTLGRRIVERRAKVKLFGLERDLRAEVAVLNGFSAHADQADLLAWADATHRKGRLSRIVLVHGEKRAQEVMREKLVERGFAGVAIAAQGERLEL
jgi:metallo-beta-lactamase family protein